MAKKQKNQNKMLCSTKPCLNIKIQTAVILSENDLPGCCGVCDFWTPCMSSLKDTDFSNDTDLSENYKQIQLLDNLSIMWSNWALIHFGSEIKCIFEKTKK